MANEENELDIEPEWCERCSAAEEETGIEYTFDYYVKDGQAYCEHCNGYL